MSAEFPNSPIEIVCRYCEAPVGEKCTTKPTSDAQWVRVLSYFHGPRWRDFNRIRGERAALDDWNNKYGGKSA
jgi:hypothetical protein